MGLGAGWRGEVSRWPLPLPHFPLEPHRTALVVVDMQNFCAHRDFGLGRSLVRSFPEAAAYYLGRLEIVIPNILRILECFRLHGWRVIFTTFGPELPDGADLPWYRRRPPTGARAYNNFPRGTPEHRILDVLAPLNHEMVINKTTSSPFTSTGIDQALRHLEVECLVFTGAATDVCVESTARDAADRG